MLQWDMTIDSSVIRRQCLRLANLRRTVLSGVSYLKAARSDDDTLLVRASPTPHVLKVGRGSLKSLLGIICSGSIWNSCQIPFQIDVRVGHDDSVLDDVEASICQVIALDRKGTVKIHM